jgi:fatty acid desaturase
MAQHSDLETLDYRGFASDVMGMRKEIQESLGTEDLKHLRKVEWMGRLSSLVGYATAWILPNPISAYLISQGNISRWMLMHHISHRGYDKVPGVPERYTSKVFASGWRRYTDWFDWIVPEAWAHEHNVLHHYHTGESEDPDLVERNLGYLRRSKLPRWRRYLHVALLASTWKASYYAPSTMHELQNERRRKAGQPPNNHSFLKLFNPTTPEGRELWLRSFLPYGIARFLLLPALFLPLGIFAALSVLATSVMAEIMTNIHAFIVIGPNHSGEDIYRFGRPVKDKREFYARQVLGSVNYRTGTERTDYLSAYLNYQIEHHLWPDIPMLKYRQFQPKAKAICEKYGLRYLQEPVMTRVGKLVDIMVGDASMKRVLSITTPQAFTGVRPANPAPMSESAENETNMPVPANV